MNPVCGCLPLDQNWSFINVKKKSVVSQRRTFDRKGSKENRDSLFENGNPIPTLTTWCQDLEFGVFRGSTRWFDLYR